MSDTGLSDQVGASRFSVMCSLTDVLEKVVAAHTEFVVSDGDNERTAFVLRDADAYMGRVFAAMGLPRSAAS